MLFVKGTHNKKRKPLSNWIINQFHIKIQYFLSLKYKKKNHTKLKKTYLRLFLPLKQNTKQHNDKVEILFGKSSELFINLVIRQKNKFIQQNNVIIQLIFIYSSSKFL